MCAHTCALERGRWKLEKKKSEENGQKRMGDHYAIVYKKLKHSRSCPLRTRCSFIQNCSEVPGFP